MTRAILTAALLASSSLLIAAEKPTAFELVPANSSATLIIRNTDDFKKNGDAFLNAVVGWPWASMAIHHGENEIQVKDIYATDRPVAVIWMNRSLVEMSEKEEKNRWLKPILVGVEINDFVELASRLQTDLDKLKSGGVITNPGKIGFDHRYSKVIGDYLWIASHKELYKYIEEGDRLADHVSKARKKHLEKADIVVAFSKEWDEFNPDATAKEAERWIQQHPDADEAEKEAIKEFFDIFTAARNAIFAWRIEPDGLQMDIDVSFDKNHRDYVRKAIRRISPKGEPAKLNALPANSDNAELLSAHAARTDGKATLPVMSTLLREACWNTHWWKELALHGFLNRSQQFEMIGLFSEVWNRLDGYRIGLYRNGNEHEHGLVSLIALLKTDDPEKFIAELRELSSFLDGTGIDPEELRKDDSPSKRKIKRLISDLASDDFATRQSAANKLTIIGGPALMSVQEAEQSRDKKLSARAKPVGDAIRAELKRKRDSALKPSVLSSLKPKFLFHENAEERDGYPVHIIEVKPQDKFAVPVTPKTLLGPTWSKVRLVPMDGQVAVLFGSNTKLLDKLIRNARRDKPGLAEDPSNSVYSRPLHARHISELHFSAQRFLAMQKGVRRLPEDKSENELMSLAITLQPAFFNVEWRIPTQEFRTIVKELWR